jgi:hypothetical protein
MSNCNELREVFGEVFGAVIHSYSREQALADGVLVDLNKIIPVNESGYKYPVACTSTVWNIIERAVNNPKYCNDYKGVVWDVLQMSRNCPTKRYATGCLFRVVIIGAGPKRIFTFKIECGPGDHREQVLTIMLPEED